MRRTVRRVLAVLMWIAGASLVLSSPARTMRDMGLSWPEILVAFTLSALACLVLSGAVVAVATLVCWAWEDPEDLKKKEVK